MALSPIDYVLFIVYLGGTLALGLWLTRHVKTSGDYFLAGRRLPFWAIGMSIVISDIGATDMIGLGSDVLILCFDGASYWASRDRFAEQGVGVITLEHGTTEMWGIESLARYIGHTWPELEVHYLDNHWRAWHVSA